jgi:DNA-binding XRE family transcriptional regulator
MTQNTLDGDLNQSEFEPSTPVKHLRQPEMGSRRLAEVRHAREARQDDIALSMGLSQSRISQIERRALSTTALGTVQAYVEALGGTLRLVADFGDLSLIVA